MEHIPTENFAPLAVLMGLIAPERINYRDDLLRKFKV